jgi:hypothetical protein
LSTFWQAWRAFDSLLLACVASLSESFTWFASFCHAPFWIYQISTIALAVLYSAFTAHHVGSVISIGVVIYFLWSLGGSGSEQEIGEAW